MKVACFNTMKCPVFSPLSSDIPHLSNSLTFYDFSPTFQVSKNPETAVNTACLNAAMRHTSFSRSSASRVLNFFCTSLMMRNAVLRLDDGAEISPGSFELELRNVLCQQNQTQCCCPNTQHLTKQSQLNREYAWEDIEYLSLLRPAKNSGKILAEF